MKVSTTPRSRRAPRPPIWLVVSNRRHSVWTAGYRAGRPWQRHTAARLVAHQRWRRDIHRADDGPDAVSMNDFYSSRKSLPLRVPNPKDRDGRVGADRNDSNEISGRLP